MRHILKVYMIQEIFAMKMITDAFLVKKSCQGYKKGIQTTEIRDSMSGTIKDDCASLCYKNSHCVAFLIDNLRNCWLKHSCSTFQYLENFSISFRYIDNRFSCFFGGLENLQGTIYVGHSSKEVRKSIAI